MKICVISYSLTGNNDALARSLAGIFRAEHIRIIETKRRTMGTIFLDLLFGRTPPVSYSVGEIGQYDWTFFVGPVWIGKPATPFRACFKQLRPKLGNYAFISISGGADGPNPKLAGELKKQLKKDPFSVIDLHIADLLPPEPKPQRKDTSAYRINDGDLLKLTGEVEAILREAVGKA